MRLWVEMDRVRRQGVGTEAAQEAYCMSLVTEGKAGAPVRSDEWREKSEN